MKPPVWKQEMNQALVKFCSHYQWAGPICQIQAVFHLTEAPISFSLQFELLPYYRADISEERGVLDIIAELLIVANETTAKRILQT